MKFSIKDFFNQCDHIRSFLQIWSYLLKKFSMENFIFCALKCVDFIPFQFTDLQVGLCKEYINIFFVKFG